MTTEQEITESPERKLLASIVDTAASIYLSHISPSTEGYPLTELDTTYHGDEEFTQYDAIEAAISAYTIDPFQLFELIRNHSYLKPNHLPEVDIASYEEWEDYFLALVSECLINLIEDAHTAVGIEEDLRKGDTTYYTADNYNTLYTKK